MNLKEASPNKYYISIEGNQFIPAELTINSGDSVIWTNRNNTEHTITFTEGEFDLKILKPDEEACVLFTESGTYDYRCDYHPNMIGQIIVE